MKERTGFLRNTRRLGGFYEEVATSYLVGQGYEVLEKNFQTRMGEIDIIAKKENVLVAFEVKFRSSGKFGSPLMAVTKKKQWHISKTFAYYILCHNLSFEAPYRFDVLGITGDGKIKHIENAFEYME